VMCHMMATNQVTSHFSLTFYVPSAHAQAATMNAARHHSPTPAQFKYVESQTDAYQQCLTAELLMHLVPLLTGTTGVDNVDAILATCMTEAAQQISPCKQKQAVQNTLLRNWFDAGCKAAKKVKNRVYYGNAADQEKQIAVQCFHVVMDRVKVCEMASKDPNGVWRASKTRKHNVCPVEMAAQLEAFRALMRPSLLRQSCQVPLYGLLMHLA